MNTSIPNYKNGGPIPGEFDYYPNCRTNTQISYPQRGTIPWESKMMSSASVKNLYTEIPNHYPPQLTMVPAISSLYDVNIRQTYPTGKGREKILGGGHMKMWPLTNAHIFESRDYTETSFPRPSWQYPEVPNRRDAHVSSQWVYEKDIIGYRHTGNIFLGVSGDPRAIYHSQRR